MMTTSFALTVATLAAYHVAGNSIASCSSTFGGTAGPDLCPRGCCIIIFRAPALEMRRRFSRPRLVSFTVVSTAKMSGSGNL
ncbi:unnamed protein product [Amoebophrya sp. A120]|nr:unnamed protein product [Amoebophrya sp. A120]|eukprot:GSA120T00001800001.1